MPSIALMTTHANFPWFRQIPGGGDCIREWRFTLNEIAEDCALVVVYDEPKEAFECPLPASRRILITSEPPGMKSYHARFANQFGHLMGPVEVPGFMGKCHLTHPALPWFFGINFNQKRCTPRLDYEALATLPVPHKKLAISVVISKKAKLPKHRARLRFVESLEKRIGSRLQIFGRGFNEIADKADSILPFAYHLVLENNDIPHFWTEKTADAYLGWALPVFSGCANLGQDFLPASFIEINIKREAESLDKIEAILEKDIWKERLSAICDARERLLSQHNLFYRLIRIAEQANQTSPISELYKSPFLLKKNSSFFVYTQIKHIIKQVNNRFLERIR